jgi:hypothetical protein
LTSTCWNQKAVAAIFGTETPTLRSGPPTRGCKKLPTTTVKRQMIQAAVDRSVLTEWRERFAKLLDNYSDVISESKTDLGHSKTVIHDIELTERTPVYTKQFPIPADHFDKIRCEACEWVKIGVCEPANSKYNSPIFCVVKKTPKHAPNPAGLAELRVVLDYCRLNAKSSPDRYSVCGVEECIQEVGFAHSKYFTMLDLTAGFWQMMLAKSARPYMAFTVPGKGSFSGGPAQWD